MPVFSTDYYVLEHPPKLDVERYRSDLMRRLSGLTSAGEREEALRQELAEMTRHVTEAVRDVIKHNKHVHDLVLDRGVVPLATWAEALDARAGSSIQSIWYKYREMEIGMQRGKYQGFAASMFLMKKPSFESLKPFYDCVFEMAGLKH